MGGGKETTLRWSKWAVLLFLFGYDSGSSGCHVQGQGRKLLLASWLIDWSCCCCWQLRQLCRGIHKAIPKRQMCKTRQNHN